MAFNDKDTGIPTVPRTADTETQRFLGAVKTQIELLSGATGDKTKRSVRVSELEDGSLNVDGSPSSPGTGSRILLAPRNLQAFNLMVAIRLTWENVEPEYSHVEVWCAYDSTYLSDAVLVGVATKPVNEFVHNATSTRQAHTYFIRAVGWDGGVSPWEPVQGGLIVPAPNSMSINTLLEELFDDSRYQTSHIIVADSFKVVQPNSSLGTAKAVFGVGNLGGVPTVGIAGDMILDGKILTRMLDAECVTADKIGAAQINAGHIQADAINGNHIAADSSLKLNEGGKLTVGMNNLIVDSSTDSLIVAPDNGTVIGTPNLSGIDYAKLTNGDIEFYLWDGASTHVKYNSMSRMEHGRASSGDLVRIPGYFKERPHVTLSPSSLPMYDPAYSASAQSMSLDFVPFSDGNLVREWAQRQWEFKPKLELQVAGGADYFFMGDTTYSDFDAVTGITGWVPGGTWYNWKSYTIPPNVQSVYVDFDFYAMVRDSMWSPEEIYRHHFAKRIRIGSYVYQESTADGLAVGRVQVRVQCLVSASPQTMYIDVMHNDHYGDPVASSLRLRVYSMYRQQANASAIGSGVINWTAYGR